ncbi:propionate CoA-transferase [Sporobacter termitidis DSM 10068]|uniref:Propionate CoA-transferase n=1 Tax=Sporobacter termitidis DSM 10068 TaxID=1123282 RepID=A0A1M5YYI5_9FIRM|nr:malonate decarboxylase subunit alpha [Sporobacter termitidis]SHI17010.1 propionate CoA-transferase [Sporobacter termitidis DSM 10068]
MPKFVSLEEAVSHVQDSVALIVGGFGSYGSPEELLEGLAARYEETGHPKNITAICGISPGDKTESTEPLKGFNIGLNRLRAEGLVDTVMVGNLTDARAIAKAVGDNKIAGYLPPMGVMVNLFRAVAGGRPGLVTRVGLGTFADPRHEGCAVNDRAREKGAIVELMEIDGQEYLFYKGFKPNVCFIRATYADEDGNLSMDHEGLTGAELEIAVATHNNGGIVIAQVEEIVRRGTLHAKNVRIHGKLVDYVVKAQNPDNHRQCYATAKYRPELTGEIRTVAGAVKPLKLSLRKVIARRAAMELRSDVIINVGSGIPSGIGSVAAEEGLGKGMTMSVESGPMGGTIQEGLSFPGVANPEVIFSQTDTIDMYDGGVLDMTFLGAAEIDEKGNVNVSKFAGRCIGAGGFIDISQNTKKVFFMGNFTAGETQIDLTGGGLKIVGDGPNAKFVKEVQQITFSGEYAVKNGQEVMYITERAVFRLTKDGLVLTEIAPGVDLEKDVLGRMEFAPIVSPELKTMDPRLFGEAKMGLAPNSGRN